MSFLNLKKMNMLKYAEVTGCTSADGSIVWLQGHGLLSQRRVCSNILRACPCKTKLISLIRRYKSVAIM